jgi:hypothetical protein
MRVTIAPTPVPTPIPIAAPSLSPVPSEAVDAFPLEDVMFEGATIVEGRPNVDDTIVADDDASLDVVSFEIGFQACAPTALKVSSETVLLL